MNHSILSRSPYKVMARDRNNTGGSTTDGVSQQELTDALSGKIDVSGGTITGALNVLGAFMSGSLAFTDLNVSNNLNTKTLNSSDLTKANSLQVTNVSDLKGLVKAGAGLQVAGGITADQLSLTGSLGVNALTVNTLGVSGVSTFDTQVTTKAGIVNQGSLNNGSNPITAGATTVTTLTASGAANVQSLASSGAVSGTTGTFNSLTSSGAVNASTGTYTGQLRGNSLVSDSSVTGTAATFTTVTTSGAANVGSLTSAAGITAQAANFNSVYSSNGINTDGAVTAPNINTSDISGSTATFSSRVRFTGGLVTTKYNTPDNGTDGSTSWAGPVNTFTGGVAVTGTNGISSKKLTLDHTILQPPSGLSADYTINLPSTAGTLATVNVNPSFSSLTVSGMSTLGPTSASSLTVAGNTATATLNSSGAASLNSLAVTAGSTLNSLNASTATVTGNTTLAGTTATSLAVSGATTLAGATASSLTVSGSTSTNTLTSTGLATVGGVSSTGGITIQGADLTVNNGGVFATGNISGAYISGTGLTAYDGGLTVQSGSTSNIAKAQAETLTVSGNSALSTLSTTGASTLKAVSATTFTATGTSTLAGVTATSATVSGTSSLAATTVTTLNATGASTLAGTTVTTLNATGNSTLAGVTATSATVSGNTTLAGTTVTTLNATGNSTLAGVTATGLTVSGGTTLAGVSATTATVTGTSTLAGVTSTGLTVSGATSLSTLTASGTATLNSNIVLNGASTQRASTNTAELLLNASGSGSLYMGYDPTLGGSNGAAFINSSRPGFANTDIYINTNGSGLVVPNYLNANALTATTATVSGASTLAAVTSTALTVTGNTAVSTLTASGTATLNSNIVLNGASTQRASTNTAGILLNASGSGSVYMGYDPTLGGSNGAAFINSSRPGFANTDLYINTNGSGLVIPNYLTANLATITTLKPTSFTQSYAPLTATSSLDFFGDSVTSGSPPNRWTTFVSTALSKTERNFGTGGNMWVDATPPVYNSHVIGNMTFLAYGVNDVRSGQVNIDQIQRIVENLAIFSCLPTSSIYNSRDVSVSKTGTWTNISAYTTYGVGLSPSGGSYSGSIAATLKGRYIAFSTTVYNTASTTSYPAFTIVIDGTTTASGVPIINQLNTSYNGSNYTSYIYLYDATTPSVNHTMVITPSLVGGYTQPFFVDYFAGFDYAQSGTTPVILTQPSNWDMTLNGGSQIVLDSYNLMLKNTARRLRTQYGLPVYFTIDSGNTGWGLLNGDLLHPNTAGHRYISNNILNVISKGEVNYLSS